MALTLYAHPFSSYCQKVLIALYENDTPFDFQLINLGDPASAGELEKLWPFKKFPVLHDRGRVVIESTIIIEYLDICRRGSPRLLPDDPAAALDARFLDRFFDTYIHSPTQKIVGDALRAPDKHDPAGVADARKTLNVAYRWLDSHMAGRIWAVGDTFSLADCSAAPALFYADWTHEVGETFPNVRSYRQRLNARPSFARCIEEARPYRLFFPLGAPDRD